MVVLVYTASWFFLLRDSTGRHVCLKVSFAEFFAYSASELNFELLFREVSCIEL